MEGLCADTDTNKAEVPNACLHQNCPLTELLDFLQWENFEELVQLQYGCKLCGEVIFKSARLLLNHIQLSHWESVQEKGHCTTTEKPTSLSPPAKGDDEASVPHSDSEDGNKGSDVNVQQVCDWLELLDSEPGQQQDGASSTQLDVVKNIKDEQATTASESADAQEIKSNASDVTDIYQQQPSGESDLEVTPKKPPKKVRAAKKVYKRKTRARNKKPSAGSADDDQGNGMASRDSGIPTTQEEVKCKLCGREFKSKKGLLRHRKNVYDQPSKCQWKCESCGDIFTTKAVKSKHKCPVKKYRCVVCSEVFDTKSAMLQHRMIHKTESGFKCESCGKIFRRLQRLKDHVNYHFGLRPYVCKICNEAFSFRNQLWYHRQVCGNYSQFTCDKCGKSFSRPHYLARHEIVHLNTKPFKCSVCDKGFNDESTMRRHRKTHTGQGMKTCEICGLRLRDSSSLNAHIKVHSGVKAFQCGYCGRSFGRKDVLLTHERVHTGEKPFQCLKCFASFRHRSGYNYHMKQHKD